MSEQNLILQQNFGYSWLHSTDHKISKQVQSRHLS